VLRSFLGGARRDASTFLGLNYYGRVRFHHFAPMIPASGAPLGHLKDFGFVCDDMVERYPQGLGYVLNYLQNKHRLPVYITEHGAASKNEAFREADLLSNLKVLHGAIQEGVDVRGFFYWSLLDNFEWQFGYAKKFGLIEVDFDDPNLTRRMKLLGEVYQKICWSNACPFEERDKASV
jgi:beta-glucosidase